jgi:hypothetical protein
MFDTPTLNVLVPILLIPVTGEAAIVAPDEIQVSCAIPQLSLVIALGTVTDALQAVALAFTIMLLGQEIDGGMLSFIVTLKLHVAVFPTASLTV